MIECSVVCYLVVWSYVCVHVCDVKRRKRHRKFYVLPYLYLYCILYSPYIHKYCLPAFKWHCVCSVQCARVAAYCDNNYKPLCRLEHNAFLLISHSHKQINFHFFFFIRTVSLAVFLALSVYGCVCCMSYYCTLRCCSWILIERQRKKERK